MEKEKKNPLLFFFINNLLKFLINFLFVIKEEAETLLFLIKYNYFFGF